MKLKSLWERACLAGLLLLAGGLSARAAQLSFANQTVTAPNGSEQVIPLSVDFQAGEHVRSLQLSAGFPANWVVTQLDPAGALLETWGAGLDVDVRGNGFDLAAAAGQDMVGTGVLAYVHVLVTGSGWMDLQSALLNQGSPSVTLVDGLFTHNLPQPLSVSPGSTAHLLPGETVQYTAGGSPSPPLAWSVGNPAVGSVSATGLFTCTGQGVTRVQVADAAGRSGQGPEIQAYAFHLQPGVLGGIAGQSGNLDLVLTNPQSAAFESVEVRLNLGHTRLTLLDVVTEGTLLQGWDQLAWSQEGTRVVVAGIAPGGGQAGGAGVLVRLVLGSSPGAGFATTFTLEDARLDEAWRVRKANGSGSWTATGSFSISPQTSSLLAGQTVQMNVSGTPNGSLTWASVNPQVAAVGATGLVTALQGGWTRITAVDPLGVGDTTGLFWVQDLQVNPASQGLPRGYTSLVPLLTGSLDGHAVESWQFRLTHPGNWLHFEGLTVAGSLSQDWSQITSGESGNTLEGAGAGPALAGSGPLVYLRFRVDANAPVGATALLQLTEFTYNEGAPAVRMANNTIWVDAAPPPIPPIDDLSAMYLPTGQARLSWSAPVVGDLVYTVRRYTQPWPQGGGVVAATTTATQVELDAGQAGQPWTTPVFFQVTVDYAP